MNSKSRFCHIAIQAGASLIDVNLKLNVVPRTKVVNLVSDSFHYGKIKRARAHLAESAAEHFPEIGPMSIGLSKLRC